MGRLACGVILNTTLQIASSITCAGVPLVCMGSEWWSDRYTLTAQEQSVLVLDSTGVSLRPGSPGHSMPPQPSAVPRWKVGNALPRSSNMNWCRSLELMMSTVGLPFCLSPMGKGCPSNRPTSPSILPAEVLPAFPAPVSVPESARWYSLVDHSAVGARDWHTPSPCWERLLAQPFVLQWPATWHRYWRIWQAMHTLSPWSPSAFRAAHVLRSVAPAHGTLGDSSSGPPSGLLDFLAATIAVRQSCGALSSRGCIWISGVPSPAGRTLLRSLLPQASFHVLPFGPSPAFVVAHASSPLPVWRSGLSSLLDGPSAAASPRVVPLRSSLVYRTRSQG